MLVIAGDRIRKKVVADFGRTGKMHGNGVFDAEMLRDAQAYPEKYENLQVRVCGWNVLWNNMTKTEQDAYILRAENISQ